MSAVSASLLVACLLLRSPYADECLTASDAVDVSTLDVGDENIFLVNIVPQTESVVFRSGLARPSSPRVAEWGRLRGADVVTLTEGGGRLVREVLPRQRVVVMAGDLFELREYSGRGLGRLVATAHSLEAITAEVCGVPGRATDGLPLGGEVLCFGERLVAFVRERPGLPGLLPPGTTVRQEYRLFVWGGAGWARTDVKLGSQLLAVGGTLSSAILLDQADYRHSKGGLDALGVRAVPDPGPRLQDLACGDTVCWGLGVKGVLMMRDDAAAAPSWQVVGAFPGRCLHLSGWNSLVAYEPRCRRVYRITSSGR